MFSRFAELAIIRASQAHRMDRNRRPCTGRRRSNRTSAPFRLEGLEDRRLLSAISSITEFPVSSTSPATGGIVVGSDGNLWFTETGNNAIGMINPTTHAVNSFPVHSGSANVFGIAAGPDGNLWFTERNADKIGMINPTTHAISEFTIPIANAHPREIVAGPDGNLWFIQSTAYIGMINPTTHAISEFPTTALSGFGITAGPDGNVWFTSSSGVAKINPTTHAVTVYSFLYGSSSFGITTGPDGNVWFTLGHQSEIGNINPATGVVSEFATPTSQADPWGITTGPDGNVWFAEDTAGQIGEINPTTDVITEYPVPGGDPTSITTGPDGNLWLTAGNAIDVATFSTSQFVVTQQPPASVTAGSPFGLTVQAEDSSGNLMTSFNGTVTVALGSNPGGATLGGTLSVQASGGVANFSGLTLTKAATGYTLDASGSGLGEGVTNAMTVTPAAATQLVITQQPPSTVKVNTAFGLQASIEDQYGNLVTTAGGTVSVAFAHNPTGATLGGTLSVTANAGVATFSGLTINKTGSGYTLSISSGGLTSAVTSAINVSKTGKSATILTPAGMTVSDAPSSLLAPLVLDSPDLWDIPGLKKRARTI